MQIKGMDIELSHVSFGYHKDKEILKDVSLSIPSGSMTAFFRLHGTISAIDDGKRGNEVLLYVTGTEFDDHT